MIVHTPKRKNVDTIFKVLYFKVNAGDAGLTLGIPPKAASPHSSWAPATADSEKKQEKRSGVPPRDSPVTGKAAKAWGFYTEELDEHIFKWR